MATVMYIPEKKQSLGAMKGVMSYVCQEKKTRDPVSGQRFVTGVHCLGDNACREFLTTKHTYHKTTALARRLRMRPRFLTGLFYCGPVFSRLLDVCLQTLFLRFLLFGFWQYLFPPSST